MTVQPEPTPEPTPTPEPAPPEPAPEPKKPDPIAEQRRRADAEKRRADALQKQIDEAERAKAEEEGRHKDLADAERKRADDAEAQLQRINAERKVERIASSPTFGEGESKTRFINPDEALALLPANTDLTDDGAVSDALTALAAQRPHLLQAPAAAPRPAASGTPGTPAPTDKPKITREYIDSLSVTEVQKLMDERPDEVSAALAGA